MCRQRLGIADIDQACKQLQRILKLRAAGQAAFDTEGQNAGWLAVEIFLRQRVIGMIFKSGIVDPIDLRMLLQILGHSQSVGSNSVQAQGQRLDALQDQKAVERRKRRAGVAQGDHARTADVGRFAQRFGIDHAVVAHVRFIEALEAFLVLGPRELAGIAKRTAQGGAIVDSGKFPWAKHKERFKRLNEPDVSYHGVVYTEALGEAAYIGRARVVPLRNTGAALSPFNSFLILQGIETLALRLDRITANTLAVAQYLKKHAKVNWVNYAGLEDHPDHALAKKYFNGKPSGILTFGVKGGLAGGAKFQDALKLFTRLVNIGDAKSLATHPASTTHRQLSPAELVKAGVTEDTVRLSIGIEHIDDLLADLEQALSAV